MERDDPSRPTTPGGPRPSRRDLLALIGGLGGAAALAACTDDDGGGGSGSADDAGSTTARPGGVAALEAPALPGVGSDPFRLGVASGDPTPTAVVLWTRLVPDPSAGAASMPAGDAEVVWEVAEDEGFDRLVATGTAAAEARWGHSVHVDADGLDPDRRYHYRFRAGEWTSPVGRTRTAPEPGADVDRLVVATGSCQDWESGHYAAHRSLAAEDDLDLVLWLGDYIYEGGPDDDGVRRHDTPEVTDVEGYRRRYGLYKGDADLQAAHAAAPWFVIWDDHEVENNYAGLSPQDPDDAPTFPDRRAAAYQVWWEHQPVRLPPPTGSDLDMYRDLRWGSLAHLFGVDTRQERADQVCAIFPGLDAGPNCPDLEDATRTIISAEQERWLVDGLAEPGSRWNLVANAVVISPVPLIGEELPEEALAAAAASIGIPSLPSFDGLRGVLSDQWDGYPQQRQRVLDAMAAAPAPTVVLTGDIHASAAGPLRAVAGDPASPVVGAEFVGTSISSGNGGQFSAIQDAIFEPAFEYYQGERRGYLRLDVTAEEVRATYVVVDDATDPDSPTRVDATFAVGADRTFARA